LKRSIITAAALLGAFAGAGLAAAKGSAATFPVLAGGPVPLHQSGRFAGYQMAVEATRVNGKTVLAVEFVRTRGSAAQAGVFVFQLPQSALRIRHDLTRATLDTRSGLGRFGRIRMRFWCRRRAVRHRCVGSARGRAGTLAGRLDVRTHVGVRVRLRSLSARLVLKRVASTSTSPTVSFGTGLPTIGRLSCGQYPHASLLAVAPSTLPTERNFTLAGLVAARQRRGPLTVLLALARQRRPATEISALALSAPRAALSLVGTKAAQFGGPRVPLLRGRLRFTRTLPFPGCPRGSLGTAIGSMRLTSGFFGPLRVFTPSARHLAILLGPVRRAG
jgi:hypothetical protein